MKNHKVVFQLYGVRRPLKFRRRMARAQRRTLSSFNKTYQFSRGRHDRWTLEGNLELWVEKGCWLP